jgi:hypothetical protein
MKKTVHLKTEDSAALLVPGAGAERTSRWWFHSLNSSYTELGTAIVREHLDACTGVYMYMDTFSTHGCSYATAAGAPCGRFQIDGAGKFSSATDAQIAERVRPYQQLGVTVSVAMDLTTASVLDGSALNGVAAAVSVAVRHNLTSIMLDYEPRTNYTEAHQRAYANLVKALAAGLHEHGLQLDMCISDWSILTAFGLYAGTGVDRMMSMGSTYSGVNVSRDMMWVEREQAGGVSPAQLAVGVGSVSSTPHPLDPGYNWTELQLAQFIGWCEQRGVQHLDLWRGDLNTLNPVDGTAKWYYSLLAKFLMKQKDDGSPLHGGDLATGDSH